MAKQSKRIKLTARQRRKKGLRKNISGTPDKPRLSVFKSNLHTYAQVISDVDGTTIASASTLDPAVKEKVPTIEIKKTHSEAKSLKSIYGARAVGQAIAEKAKAKGVETVVFDRNGFIYHGRVKALAEGARAGGLKF